MPGQQLLLLRSAGTRPQILPQATSGRERREEKGGEGGRRGEEEGEGERERERRRGIGKYGERERVRAETKEWNMREDAGESNILLLLDGREQYGVVEQSCAVLLLCSAGMPSLPLFTLFLLFFSPPLLILLSH